MSVVPRKYVNLWSHNGSRKCLALTTWFYKRVEEVGLWYVSQKRTFVWDLVCLV